MKVSVFPVLVHVCIIYMYIFHLIACFYYIEQCACSCITKIDGII